MPGSPRPADPRFIVHEIGAVTLIGGQRVINCWEIWMGGFAITHRYAINDPAEVHQAAEWAIEHHARWKPCGGQVRSIDQVIRVFVR